MFKRLTRRTLLAAAVCGMAPPVGLWPLEALARDLRIRISFASPYATYCAPYLIAKDFGWFTEAGLVTEDIILNSDANATRALISGSSDLAMTGPLNVFNAVEGGAAIKWIGSWQTSVDYVLVVSKAITSIAQLQEKTFATSGPSGLPQALPSMLLRKRNVPTDNLKYVAVGGHSARLQSVIAGRADAAIVNELTGLIGERNGSVRILAAVTDEFPLLGYIVLAARDDDLRDPEKRRALEILMSGSMRGARFIKEDPERAAQILLKYLPGSELDLLVSVLKKLNGQNVWPVEGGVSDDVTEFTAKLEYSLGETKRLFKPSEVSDASIVAAVLSKEGRKP